MEFVIVSGYHGSGSSAVTDLLMEFEGFYNCNSEIRLVCDPYGIKELKRKLISDWDWINASVAITDFWSLCKKLSRRGGGKNPFAQFGLNYSKTINKDFMSVTKNYLSKLVEFEYNGDLYAYKAKKNYWKYVTDRWRYGIEIFSHGKIPLANRRNIAYFSKPTEETFDKATKEYFDDLFETLSKKNKLKFILLDLALSPEDALLIRNFFSKAKMIIVDRDPRDILANLLERRCPHDIYHWIAPKYEQNFSKWQKAMREVRPVGEDILYVNFEDIILETDKIKKNIADFIGFDINTQIYKHKYLKPEISIKNIGYWKKYYNKFPWVFDNIEKNMTEYLYVNRGLNE